MAVTLLDKYLLNLAIARDPELTGGEKACGTTLVDLYNVDRGCAWPSYATLATMAHVSLSTAKTSIRKLVGRGYFQVSKGGGRGFANTYAPCFDRAKQCDGQHPLAVNGVNPHTLSADKQCDGQHALAVNGVNSHTLSTAETVSGIDLFIAKGCEDSPQNGVTHHPETVLGITPHLSYFPVGHEGEVRYPSPLEAAGAGAPLLPPGGKGAQSADPFEQLWEAYPRHEGRKEAREAFRQAVASGADPARMTAKARLYRGHVKALSTPPHKVRWLHTWITDEIWMEDYVSPPRAPNARAGEQAKPQSALADMEAELDRLLSQPVCFEQGTWLRLRGSSDESKLWYISYIDWREAEEREVYELYTADGDECEVPVNENDHFDRIQVSSELYAPGDEVVWYENSGTFWSAADPGFSFILFPTSANSLFDGDTGKPPLLGDLRPETRWGFVPGGAVVDHISGEQVFIRVRVPQGEVRTAPAPVDRGTS